jgi:hypothetical protein
MLTPAVTQNLARLRTSFPSNLNREFSSRLCRMAAGLLRLARARAERLLVSVPVKAANQILSGTDLFPVHPAAVSFARVPDLYELFIELSGVDRDSALLRR